MVVTYLKNFKIVYFGFELLLNLIQHCALITVYVVLLYRSFILTYRSFKQHVVLIHGFLIRSKSYRNLITGARTEGYCLGIQCGKYILVWNAEAYFLSAEM